MRNYNFTKEEHKKFTRMFADGMMLKDIAEALGRSNSWATVVAVDSTSTTVARVVTYRTIFNSRAAVPAGDSTAITSFNTIVSYNTVCDNRIAIGADNSATWIVVGAMAINNSESI